MELLLSSGCEVVTSLALAVSEPSAGENNGESLRGLYRGP